VVQNKMDANSWMCLATIVALSASLHIAEGVACYRCTYRRVTNLEPSGQHCKDKFDDTQWNGNTCQLLNDNWQCYKRKFIQHYPEGTQVIIDRGCMSNCSERDTATVERLHQVNCCLGDFCNSSPPAVLAVNTRWQALAMSCTILVISLISYS